MDAITLLKQDHRAVEQLFKQFEKTGPGAAVAKRSIVDRIIEALAAHAAIEEQLFYPAVRATVPGTDAVTLESLEEHHIVKWSLSELDGMDPRNERFDAKVTVLIENVRHHVKEEESELFPKVREELGRKALAELGDALDAAKQAAPSHAHPRSPDEPPGNVVAGAAAAVADRFGDSLSGLAQGGANVVNDLIARILDRKPAAHSPQGSRTTRRVATHVRSSARRATDRSTGMARATKQTAKRQTSAARSAGRRATTATKRAAQRRAG